MEVDYLKASLLKQSNMILELINNNNLTLIHPKKAINNLKEPINKIILLKEHLNFKEIQDYNK